MFYLPPADLVDSYKSIVMPFIKLTFYLSIKKKHKHKSLIILELAYI